MLGQVTKGAPFPTQMCFLCCASIPAAVADKDLASAKALYERALEEGLVMDELSLKRLAVLHRDAGETPPFPEPPVSAAAIYLMKK